MKKPFVVAEVVGIGLLLALSAFAAYAGPIAPGHEPPPPPPVAAPIPVGDMNQYSEGHKVGSVGIVHNPRWPVAGKPGDYWLERRVIADAVPKALVWDVQRPTSSRHQDGNPPAEVFLSLKSKELRSWVDILPTHSAISYVWVTSGHGSVNAEQLPPALEAELDDFAQYCKSRDVTFFVLKVSY